MLQNIDTHTLNKLMAENSDARQIITQLLDNHQTIVSTISHEIRNPLTLISSALQIIESSHPEVKSFFGWTQLMDDVSFLRLLLEELSSFNNGHVLTPSIFSIDKLLKNISLSFAMSLENLNSNIEFTSEISKELGDFTGDKLKLEEVILNLLSNAKDAVGQEGKIRLSAVLQDDSLLISIEDNGCGISKEHMERIFDPFITYKSGGTGLGLAISKQITQAHGGILSVESAEGTGSIFSVRLPL